jgi:hypothetical protein
VIAGMSKSGVWKLVHTELEKLVAWNHQKYISIDNWKEDDIFTEWPKVIGIIDCTELSINAWHRNAFSVKKAHHTIKYQVVINISNGKLLHIYGPFKGSRHDAKVYTNSGLALWLLNHNLQILGDKAYVGSSGVIASIKKSNFRYSKRECKNFNLKLSQKRILIENHFAHLKIWKILTHCYRGDIEQHAVIFWGCEILECIRKG